MRILIALFWMMFLPSLAQATPSSDPRKVALVIGNGNYDFVASLPNASNDAKLIATTLMRDGFTLIGGGPQLNLGRAEFEHVIQEFGHTIDGADAAVFYYAGHGLQIGGVNYLVPREANPTREADSDYQLIDADHVLHQMRDSDAKLNIIILDACRNNPFGGRGLRALSGGLAQMQAPVGTFISYATQPGNVAADGVGGNGPYAKALAAAMQQPGLDLFQVFNQAGLAVAAETGGQQQPWMSNSPIQGQFFFVPPGSTVTILAPGKPIDPEVAFWESVRDGGDVQGYQAYLQQYPSGIFASLAKLKIGASGSTVPIPVPADAGRFLSKEPPIGTLKQGVRVLVDDQTCPAGQVKELTGGSTRDGIPRESRCIVR